MQFYVFNLVPGRKYFAAVLQAQLFHIAVVRMTQQLVCEWGLGGQDAGASLVDSNILF